MTIPAAFLIAFLTGHGYGPAQRDAVVWNAARESGLDPAKVSPDGRHIALFQYNGPRRHALVRYALSRGKHWSDTLSQLEFMDSEWRSMRASRAFFAAKSASVARWIFCTEYERAARC